MIQALIHREDSELVSEEEALRRIKEYVSSKESEIPAAIYESLQGWNDFAKKANTYKLRMKIITLFTEYFSQEISSIEINRLIKAYSK